MRPCSASSTKTSPSVRSSSGGRARSEEKYGASPRNSPSVHTATTSASPGHAAAACNGAVADPVQAAETAGGPPIVRCPPTIGTPNSSPARAIPPSTCPAWCRSGLTTVSTSAIGRPPDRTHVGDVRGHRGNPRRVRVAQDQVGGDGLRAHDEELPVVGNDRSIVTGANPEPAQQAEVTLGLETRRGAHDARELRETVGFGGHR